MRGGKPAHSQPFLLAPFLLAPFLLAPFAPLAPSDLFLNPERSEDFLRVCLVELVQYLGAWPFVALPDEVGRCVAVLQAKALPFGKRLAGGILAVRIAGLREVHPVRRHLIGDRAVLWGLHGQ